MKCSLPVEPLAGMERVDDPDESTVLDIAEPDNEPTMFRPAPMPYDLAHEAQFARAASPGAGPKRAGRLGKYELRNRLGRGAFGVVFTARDPSLDRDVAIKVLRPAHLTNPTIVQRFLQEARATARIAHPGIVTIHDCGQIETSIGVTAFIVMELLSGESLASRLTRCSRLTPAAAVEIARQVASALEAAHRADVLHRDLKPDNIHVVPDPAIPRGERVKVLDFGLAKLGHGGHTHFETVFGTPRYMSPEQCRSTAQVDHRSDIYSLGCILFELVTGKLPFEGEVRQLLEHHQFTVPPRASSFAPEVSPLLDELIAEMLAKDPMERPQTMGAVQRALQRVAAALKAEATLRPVETSGLPTREVEAVPCLLQAEPPSGEILVPPSGPRTAITEEAPMPPLPRLSPAKLVGLGALVAAVSALFAWVTAG